MAVFAYLQSFLHTPRDTTIVFAHLATTSISVKVMLLTPAFRNIDSSLEEASRVSGAGGVTTLLRVVLPVLTPALVVTFLLALIRSLEAFEIELILGTPIGFQVYSTKIYQLIRGSPPDYASATILATAILAVMIPFIVLQRWLSTRRTYSTLTGQYRSSVTQLMAWRWPAFGLVVLVLVFLTVIPLAFQLAGSLMMLFGYFDLPQVWTLRHWERALSDTRFLRALGNTLMLSGGTAVLAVITYSLVAYCTVRLRHSLRGALDVLAWVPFAVPGLILGLGYLWMVLQVPLFRPVYGTLGVLILVSWLGSITLGVQILKTGMVQLGRDLEEAGRVAGASWLRTFRDVVVPLSLTSMGVVAIMVFAITARQVSTVILLATGQTTPLAVLQLEFLYGGELGAAAVVGTVIVLMSLGAAVLAAVLVARYGARLAR